MLGCASDMSCMDAGDYYVGSLVWVEAVLTCFAFYFSCLVYAVTLATKTTIFACDSKTVKDCLGWQAISTPYGDHTYIIFSSNGILDIALEGSGRHAFIFTLKQFSS